MDNLLTKILITFYGATAVINIIAYWPTIKDLWNKKPSANFYSYLLWSVASLIAFLYSLIILPDLLFQVVSSTLFMLNLLVLILIFKNSIVK